MCACVFVRVGVCMCVCVCVRGPSLFVEAGSHLLLLQGGVKWTIQLGQLEVPAKAPFTLQSACFQLLHCFFVFAHPCTLPFVDMGTHLVISVHACTCLYACTCSCIAVPICTYLYMHSALWGGCVWDLLSTKRTAGSHLLLL